MDWNEPTPVGVDGLLAHLIHYLTRQDPPDDVRLRADRVPGRTRRGIRDAERVSGGVPPNRRHIPEALPQWGRRIRGP
ncbi:hypothetical protein GCM10010244_83400 [Streptomyces coeruleorubidus]|nr:hypothetical protein GCM10010244_83400 [Streptomyces bellus]